MKQKGLAIITGASKGIGACVAKGLAVDGYQPVLIARDGKKLESVANEIKNSEGDIKDLEPIIIQGDISDNETLKLQIAQLEKLSKPVSVLVNSAGMWLDGSLSQSIQDFQHVLNINLVAQYAIIQQVVETMKQQKSGYIFNIASRAGKYGFADGGIYSASKFALVGLSESLYHDLAPFGIKVTSLCPGWVNTEMAYEAGTKLAPEEMIQPADILNTIRYLLSLSTNACVKEVMIECMRSML